jgi:hypothetical protein
MGKSSTNEMLVITINDSKKLGYSPQVAKCLKALLPKGPRSTGNLENWIGLGFSTISE